MTLHRDVTSADVTSATLPLSIKQCWFHLAKGQAGREGPWASCWVIRCTYLKMASKSNTVGHRVKRIEIWDSGLIPGELSR